MTDEQKEHVRLWVAALRSGEFAQTTGRLRKEHAYCCLGVACELYRRETAHGEWGEFGRFSASADSSVTSLPLVVASWFGVGTSPSAKTGTPLVDMNDLDAANFGTIADAIEQQYLREAA